MKVSGKWYSMILAPVLAGLLAVLPIPVRAEAMPAPAESVSEPAPAESAPTAVTTAVNLNAIKDCNNSNAEGAMAAGNNHSAAGWWVGGILSGVLLGLIGTGIIWGISFASNPMPKAALIPNDVETSCYFQGYSKEAKGKNKTGAALGGLIGTAAFLVIYLTAIAPSE